MVDITLSRVTERDVSVCFQDVATMSGGDTLFFPEKILLKMPLMPSTIRWYAFRHFTVHSIHVEIAWIAEVVGTQSVSIVLQQVLQTRPGVLDVI